MYVQPGFVFKMELLSGPGVKYNSPSVLELKFVNGQERKYHMGLTQWTNIMTELKYINNLIEFERSLAG